jgi:hypothetical protein
MRSISLGVATLLAIVIGGCANVPASRITPVKSSEHECRLRTDPARCKLEHDLAGGYPFAINDR